MGEWTTYQLRDIGTIFDGPHATPTKVNDGPWFLSISSLKNGRLDLSESAHVSEADYARWTRRVTPQEGDLLFSYETRLGDAALMPPGISACLGRRMALIRPNPKIANPHYLLYFYLSEKFQSEIRKRTVYGATVNRIPLNEMPQWPASLPGLHIQQAIAEVLGALDDKIAANEQVTTTSEQVMAAMFSHLRCDVETPDGVPAGNVVHFNPRQQPRPPQSAVYVDMASLPTATARINSWTMRPPKGGSRFLNGDTLLARITPCLENGKTGFVDFLPEGETGTGSTEFIVMRAQQGIPTHFPYFLARSPRFRQNAISNMVGSSGRQRCPAQPLEQHLIRLPDEQPLFQFDTAARKFFEMMKSLDAESRTLAALRDALLPELVSGRLAVKDAEKQVSDVV